jgi:hypothetical protein
MKQTMIFFFDDNYLSTQFFKRILKGAQTDDFLWYFSGTLLHFLHTIENFDLYEISPKISKELSKIVSQIFVVSPFYWLTFLMRRRSLSANWSDFITLLVVLCLDLIVRGFSNFVSANMVSLFFWIYVCLY